MKESTPESTKIILNIDTMPKVSSLADLDMRHDEKYNQELERRAAEIEKKRMYFFASSFISIAHFNCRADERARQERLNRLKQITARVDKSKGMFPVYLLSNRNIIRTNEWPNDRLCICDVN